MSYADVLRRVDPALKELNDNAARIRRTQKRGLLFELSKKKKYPDELQKTIEASSGEQTTVHVGRPIIGYHQERNLLSTQRPFETRRRTGDGRGEPKASIRRNVSLTMSVASASKALSGGKFT